MLINLLLLLVARLLCIVLVTISAIYTHIKFIVQSIYRRKGLKWLFAELGNYYWQVAITDDRAGQVKCQHLFNDLMIRPESKHRFGKIKQTASWVFGKNKKENTMYPLGDGVAKTLNWIDKNHVENAIDTEEEI